MREFLMLPLIFAGTLVMVPLALFVIAVYGIVIWLAEQDGWARIGGLHQDDW